MTRNKPAAANQVRCAIYTRKSSEEGLDQAFSSLHAQREAAEAFIASQRHEGWVCLPERYDDGGYSGGNTERPALRRLMADIEAGKVDAVVVYKVDRLSRSLLDFARLMGTFERHNVSFVSVTQQFNTAHSMGRLTLNILLSFAQFERELVSERTRDKIAATRRKGKWSGGRPILGYDVDRERMRLVVNPAEAERVREIVALYLRTQSLLATARELNRRGWTTKKWTSRDGRPMGGAHLGEDQPLDAPDQPAVRGEGALQGRAARGGARGDPGPSDVRAGAADAAGQRARRRDAGAQQVRGAAQRHPAVRRVRRGDGPHLQLPRPEGLPLLHVHQRPEERLGCVPVPVGARRSARAARAPADPRRRGDPALVSEAVRAARAQEEEAIASLERGRRVVERDLRRVASDLAEAARSAAGDPVAAGRLADLHDRAAAAQRRLAEIDAALDRAQGRLVDEEALRQGLARFDGAWEQLSPKERARMVALLVGRVDHDPVAGEVTLTFLPCALRSLGQVECEQEARA